MRTSRPWLIHSAFLVGCLGLLIPATALASKARKPAFRISDEAKLFSNDAIEKAEGKIDKIKTDYDKDVLIETYSTLPEGAKKDFDTAKGDKEKVNTFWGEFARNRYKSKEVRGIYLLVVKDPKHLHLLVGEDTRKKAFTRENRDKAVDDLMASFKDKKFDAGLLAFIDYVDTTLNRNIGKVSSSTATGTSRTSATNTNKAVGFFSTIPGMICIGLVVVLAVWLVFGLFRALFSGGRPIDRAPGGPGAGGGGPGYAGGGGGGGGGFMTSMLGGLFGAAAGMYLYDSFFRGSSPAGSSMTPTAYGSSPTPDDGDRDVADSGRGGDWSGGSAADDAGAGGDWGGGGGDAGGGGDWGGGGGDAGGGGGDWGGGGGGGGDWGGGGGDGGGGGGDW